MKAYNEFIDSLDGFIDSIEWGKRPFNRIEPIHNLLNGGAMEALHVSTSKSAISASGAFFTPETLARKAIVGSRIFAESKKVLDPACGAGDLLLRWAELLPIRTTLESTLLDWSQRLFGFDIHKEFLEATKRRLVLLAIRRGAVLKSTRPPSYKTLFCGLKEKDFTKCKNPFEKIDVVVMNPPFTLKPNTAECNWTSGSVNMAAIFVEKALNDLSHGKSIVAILPEVLRSGTRYKEWRNLVSNSMDKFNCNIWGKFSDKADVDVFIMRGIKSVGSQKSVRWTKRYVSATKAKIGEISTISVGAVVPHRHKDNGPHVSFISTKNTPPWEIVKRISEKRMFKGTLHYPPFVVMRRTSSPHDPYRAIGSIVIGKRAVAVENHLIVIAPNTKTLAECRRILKSIRDRKTTAWLNFIIRCRHLTVGAIKSMPLFNDIS
jgi:hypothetical protein